jgi:hypothetical protein
LEVIDEIEVFDDMEEIEHWIIINSLINPELYL